MTGSLWQFLHQPCGCDSICGDDGDTEGPGVCKELPLPIANLELLDRGEHQRRHAAQRRAIG